MFVRNLLHYSSISINTSFYISERYKEGPTTTKGTKKIKPTTMINTPLQLLILFLVATTTCSIAPTEKHEKEQLNNNNNNNEFDNDINFNTWLTLHNNNKKKHYKSKEDLLYREKVFEQNKNIITDHNKAYDLGYTTWKMSIVSPFSDLTSDEFVSFYLMDSQDCSATTTSTSSQQKKKEEGNKSLVYANDTDVSIDWRTKGIMTPIKDQGK